MKITAYDLALIAGGFTIIGALIGALAAYWLTTYLEKNKEHRAACATLRAAFAPTLALIYIARNHGTHNRPDIDTHIKSALLDHGAAIEDFRPFIAGSDSTAYQKAWEDYRKISAMDSYSIAAEAKILNLQLDELLEHKILDILRFAKIYHANSTDAKKQRG